MTKETFIGMVRLTKKIYNSIQEGCNNNQGYLGLLHRNEALLKKLDAQLKLIKANQQLYYAWQADFVKCVRKLRAEQNLYIQTHADSRMEACNKIEGILNKGFDEIKRMHPEVLSTPNTQSNLFAV